MEENTFNKSEEHCSSQNSSDTFLIGFIVAKIVGMQYYHGKIHGRQLVGLIREPMNPSDPNAIKVVNKNEAQIGHIERAAALTLSPLIDDRIVMIQGIVPRARYQGDSAYKISCQIHVFCKISAFPHVKSAISRPDLQFIFNSDASFTLSDAASVRQTRATLPQRNLDDVFRSAGDNSDKNERLLDVLDAPRDVIISKLFLHQKEGLRWLFHRENSNQLPPFWEMHDGAYVNLLTNFKTCTRPGPLRGGIFADDMGLGKTLTLLSLIALDGYEEHSSSFNTEMGALSKSQGSRRNTLIVCPPSAISDWVAQLELHTKPGSLNVYMYYGERTKEVEILKRHDIVITTYNTLSLEHNWKESPVKRVGWWRIILDEAHVIKNLNSTQSRAVIELRGERRWAVTGIPLINYTHDMFSFMAFLRFQPFSILSCWNTLIKCPLVQDYQRGWSRLQVLIDMLSLRRTKEEGVVGLPPKTVEMCYVELCPDEREVYDPLEEEAKRFVREKETTYHKLFEIVFRLRQICTHAALCPPNITSLISTPPLQGVSEDPELTNKVLEMVEKEGGELDCPVCLAPPTRILITRCSHIFCGSCLRSILEQADPRCPLCRRRLSRTDIFSSEPSGKTSAVAQADPPRSSKAAALLRLLTEAREKDPCMKSVVFSQFGGALLLLEEQLWAGGFKTVRLDGQMGVRKRTRLVKEFTGGGATVMLAGRGVAAGLDLTAASTVWMLEPWWDPWVEERAVDRVHRIGQIKGVRVVKMVVRNSVEEKMVDLQKKKKKMVVSSTGDIVMRSMDVLTSLFS